jgi:hypothetical protein
MVAATLLTLSLSLPGQLYANEVRVYAHYQAKLRPVQGENPLAGKEFEITVLTVDEDAVDVAWGITSETGLAALAWPARMGTRKRGVPVIRVDWGDGDSQVRLPELLLRSVEDPLTRGEREFRIGKETWFAGDPKDSSAGKTWKVIRKGGLGGGASATIDESGWPVKLTTQFTVGRGFAYELTMTRTRLSRLTADEMKQANGQLATWLKLVDDTGFAVDEESTPRLSREQLKSAVVALNQMAETKTIWSKVVAHSQKSLRKQGASSVAVEVMVERIMGKQIWPTQAFDLRDNRVAPSTFKEGIVVLHFWNYQERPLKQPYGQVGFLDFLCRKRKDIQFVGVVSHESAQRPETKQDAMRSARKFRDFMNVSYPIVVANNLLREIGDPRQSGGQLPMFVVLNAEGKVAYVQVGLFDVDPQRGLTQLEAAIDKVINQRR